MRKSSNRPSSGSRVRAISGLRDAHVLLHLGVAYAGSGREELAARHLSGLSCRRGPADEEALYQLGRAYLALASEAYGHLDGAGEFYRQKLLADLHAELNRPDAEVAERFRAAIRLDDSYPDLRVGLARALASQGLVDEARQALAAMHSLVEAHPGNPAIRTLIGETYKEPPFTAHHLLLDAAPGSFRTRMLRARRQGIQYRQALNLWKLRRALAKGRHSLLSLSQSSFCRNGFPSSGRTVRGTSMMLQA